MPNAEQSPDPSREVTAADQEVERKFVVKAVPENIESYPHKSIDQGYAFIAADGTEIRVRRKGEKYFLTGKSGKGQVRIEQEHQISAEEYESLWTVTGGRRVEKTRYDIPLDAGGVAELDIYHGRLDGLVTTEVEFPSTDEAQKFVAPDWMGEEVTEDLAYKNQSLAVHGLPERRSSPEGNSEVQENPEYDIDQGLIIAKTLIDLRRAAVDRPLIVELAGGSASGKTSAVGRRLVEAYGDEATMLSLDNYYRGGEFMADEKEKGNELNFDQPEALDLPLVAEHLQQLRSGQPIEEPIYSFKDGGVRTGTKEFQPKPVVIAEGLFTLDNHLSEIGDVKIYVDIGTHGQFLRRIMRDVNRTDWSPQQIIDYFSTTVAPMHEKYVAATKANADVVIRNEYRPVEEADRAGMYEQQLKFPSELSFEQLRKLGGEKLSHTTQVDHYLNPTDRELTSSDEMLRIRDEGDTKTLTYKGPKKSDEPYRKRPKFEFEIDNTIQDHFLSAYGKEFRTISKERTMYRYRDALLSIDVVKKAGAEGEQDLGTWTEIRFPENATPEQVEQTIRDLGLNPATARRESYIEM